MLNFCERSGAKDYQSGRSRQELSNKYLIGEIGFDTAENELLKVSITDHTSDHIPSNCRFLCWIFVCYFVFTVAAVTECRSHTESLVCCSNPKSTSWSLRRQDESDNKHKTRFSCHGTSSLRGAQGCRQFTEKKTALTRTTEVPASE